jgi:predicted Zn-dependent protease
MNPLSTDYLTKTDMKPTRYILLFILISSCVSLQESPVSGTKRAYAYSWADEVKMGKEYDPQIVAAFGLLDDPEMTAYVVRVGNEVLAESHLRRDDTKAMFKNTEFTFRVLDSPVVNAFALPGGYNYVTRGLLAHLENEAQLAMVLGHEVGHVAARHASQQALTQTAGSLLVIGGAVLAETVLGGGGQQVMDLGGGAAQLLFLSYSRDAERESDRLGVEYAARAGYLAAEGSKFFTSLKRMSEASGQRIPSHLSSHPDPGDREVDIRRRSERFKEQGYAQETIARDRYLAAIDGIMVGENPREGFVKDGLFIHPDLKFQFGVPSGWRVQNGKSAVVMVEANQKAVMQFTIVSDVSSPAEAVDQIGNQEGVTVIDRQAVSGSSFGAYRMIAEMSDDKGNVYTFHITALKHGDNLYRFVGYSLKSDFSAYQSAFSSATGAFDQLTNQTYLDVKPTRLRVITTTRQDAFKNFLPNPMPMNLTPDEIAIMNQVFLDDVIPTGTKIKIPI